MNALLAGPNNLFLKLEMSWCGLESCYSHEVASSEKEADQELGRTTAIYLWSPVWLHQEFSSVLKDVNLQSFFYYLLNIFYYSKDINLLLW